MFFKFLPWDLSKARTDLITKGQKGILAINSSDPYLEKMFLRKIPKEYIENQDFKVLIGNELTYSFIEENLINIGLFSDNSPYLILLAEQASKEAIQLLIEQIPSLTDRLVVLCYSSAGKTWDEVKKTDAIDCIQIEAPRFWESKKLLQFLCDELGVELGYELQNAFIQEVNFDTGDYLQALKNLALLSGSLKIHDPMLIQKAISEHRIDHFELANLFGAKLRHKFIDLLERLKPDHIELMGLFTFLERHLGKMLDPSFIDAKNRPTKYDQEIKTHSQLWEPRELVEEMGFIGQLVISAKSKDPLIYNKMRLRWQALH